MKAAYTVITEDYLFLASLLGQSFKKYNPQYTFHICIVDETPSLNYLENKLLNNYEVLLINDMNIPGIESMRERYSMFELCCALKPFCADFLMETSDYELLLYFDVDILVFNNFDYIESLTKDYRIMLTPHVLSPIDDFDKTPTEMNFLRSGVYNAGFFGLVPSKETQCFIDWWKERLWYLCYQRTDQGLNADQLWLNYAPIYFEKVHIIKHPGYNMAGYNLHERNISRKNGRFFVNNKFPLVFYHYTDFNVKKLREICASQTRYNTENRLDLIPVLEEYANKFS